MQQCGFDPTLGRGDFSYGLNMGSDSIPQKTLSDESVNRGSSLCTHALYCRDSKDPDIHVLDRECGQQEHTQHASSTKTECDYLNGWIRNGFRHKNLNQNGEP